MTKENIEVVTASLAAYLACNNRLPRPDNFGDGLESKARGIINDYVGNVPYRALGISEKQAKDGNARPLVYAVEPNLTLPFENIYFANYLSTENYFCSEVRDPKIHVDPDDPNAAADVVAFVIDITDNAPVITANAIYVKISTYTCWMRRNFFLIKYLKNSPCNCETPEKTSISDPSEPQNDVENFFGE